MSKPQEYSDKLRGDFRRYLLKLACNKSDATLNEAEILKAFDLAVQRQRLTTLEAAMLAPKETKKTVQATTDIPGLSVKVGADGVWLNFDGKLGRQASINMNNYCSKHVGIVGRAVADWCALQLLAPKQLIMSKIDVSGDALRTGTFIHEVIILLNGLAEWQTEDIEYTDEKHAAAKARNILNKYEIKP